MTRKVPSAKPVTMQDIADKCKVSRVTVSYALRGNRSKVSTAMRRNIRRVARQLGYDSATYHSARRLAQTKKGCFSVNRLIGLFFPFPMIDHPYFYHLFRGMTEVFTEERFGLLTNYTDRGISNEDILPFFARGDVDGVIVYANPTAFQPVLNRLRNLPNFGQHPIVSLIQPFPDCSAVVGDDRVGGRQAAHHLLELGHRHIFCFIPQQSETISHFFRFTGYLQAYAEYGLDTMRYLHTADWTALDKLCTVLARVLKKHPEITGILAPHDEIAHLIYDFLISRGLRVPKDISLIGYDDIEPILGTEHENILTTIRVPLREIGKAASRLIIAQILRTTEQKQTVTLPVELIVRATTGPPRTTGKLSV